MCSESGAWTHTNHPTMPEEMVQERLRRARAHLQVCTKLYAIQIQQGRYLLQEHPVGAISWKETCIQFVLGKRGVIHVKADQCQYGLTSTDGLGKGLLRKIAGFMINVSCIALQLQKRCPNRCGRVIHRHVILEGGRTTPTQIYTDGLCKAIFKVLWIR